MRMERFKLVKNIEKGLNFSIDGPFAIGSTIKEKFDGTETYVSTKKLLWAVCQVFAGTLCKRMWLKAKFS
jgi:hypothetical protein